MTRRDAQRVACCAILLGIVSALCFPQTPRSEVIGYFPSWKWRAGGRIADLDRVAFDKLTVINYAFFVPHRDGSIAGKDAEGDRRYLGGAADSTLVGRAHRHGVKVVLSIGGWTDSENFPRVASTSGLRAAFAHSCATAAARWDLDGIDIDWEYPGYEEHGGTIADRRNFTLLLRSLSDTLIALGRLAGKQYLLTAALPAGGVHVRNIEAAEVAEVLDRVNLMTYDFYGPWDPLTNHNSPLYPSPGSDPSRCVDASVRLYRDTLGVPASKLTIGIPFYGKAYARCVALNTPHGGADTTHFRPGGPFYYDIAPVAASFTARWDEQARVPYLVHPAWQVLVSYDDPASIRAKAEYAVAQGLGGVIIWEITGDVMPDGATPLLDALVGTFKLTGSQVR